MGSIEGSRCVPLLASRRGAFLLHLYIIYLLKLMSDETFVRLAFPPGTLLIRE